MKIENYFGKVINKEKMRMIALLHQILDYISRRLLIVSNITHIPLMILTLIFNFQFSTVHSQSVEVFAGHKKTTVDIMFFRFIKNKEGHNSKFLFFNRNRASIDYAMTETTNLPQFGFTEAFSYNHEKLKGFAPVVVASILNRGVYPKAGFQYAKIKMDYTIFSWLVAETLQEPNIDFFFLGRYTPKLTDKLNLFSQIELVNYNRKIEMCHFVN